MDTTRYPGALKFKFFVYILVISLSLSVLYHCAVNPVTGKKELMLISESAEIKMGQDVDRGIKAEYGIYNDPQLNAYIARLGQRMTPNTHRPNLKYHFAVLDTPVVNAFAAPGGYIYVTRGLLSMLNSEAELAAVIGHELGHVNARHSARSLSRNMLFTVGLAIAGELSEKVRKYAPLAQVATQLLFLKYSRSDEYQADALGIDYASKVGYQAGEMVNFFNSLQRMTKEAGGHSLPNFLSTHPLTPLRIEKVKALINAPGYPAVASLKVNRNPYLSKINGLVFGDDPRQGFVQGNTFYHAGMAFAFNIPQGWKVQNTPKKVTLSSPDGKAVLMLGGGSSNQALNTFVDEQLKSIDSKFNILSQGFVNINGLRAFHKTVETLTQDNAGNQQKDINVLVTGIKKGNMVFSFFAASKATDYSAYKNTIESTIVSFRNLPNARSIHRPPVRVVIERAGRGQTLQGFLQSRNIPKQSWQRIALLNGAQLNTQLSPNQLVKIIR